MIGRALPWVGSAWRVAAAWSYGCPHKDLLFGAVGDEPFEHINVYYEANSDETGDPHHWMMRPFDFVPDNYDELMVRVEALEALNAAATLDSRLNQIAGATNLLRTMFDPSPRTRADERMARARAYIETHFAEPICLDDLAARYGMGAQRFSCCFARALPQKRDGLVDLKRSAGRYANC